MNPIVRNEPVKPLGFAIFIVGFKRYFDMVQTIRNIRSTSSAPIFLALDGLGDSIDLPSREKFKQYILAQFAGVRIFEGKQNLGCALGVVSAIDYLFDVSGSSTAAILEDDCIPTPEFLERIEGLLSKLETSELMISGQNPFRLHPSIDVFTSYPMIHGWAISCKKWQILRSNFSFPVTVHFRKEIPWRARMFWKLNVLKVEQGLLDTWDSHFVRSSWMMKEPIRLLGQGQVRNIGYVSTRDEGVDVRIRSSIAVNSSYPPESSDIDHLLLEQFFELNNVRAIRWSIQILLMKLIQFARKDGFAMRSLSQDMRHNFEEVRLKD